MLRELTIQYVTAFAYERRPDYTRNLGGEDKDKERWARADAMGERLQKAVLRITELPSPANVGSHIRAYGADVETSDELRMFDNMGTYTQ
jgi:hypothetical protein